MEYKKNVRYVFSALVALQNCLAGRDMIMLRHLPPLCRVGLGPRLARSERVGKRSSAPRCKPLSSVLLRRFGYCQPPYWMGKQTSTFWIGSSTRSAPRMRQRQWSWVRPELGGTTASHSWHALGIVWTRGLSTATRMTKCRSRHCFGRTPRWQEMTTCFEDDWV